MLILARNVCRIVSCNPTIYEILKICDGVQCMTNPEAVLICLENAEHLMCLKAVHPRVKKCATCKDFCSCGPGAPSCTWNSTSQVWSGIKETVRRSSFRNKQISLFPCHWSLYLSHCNMKWKICPQDIRNTPARKRRGHRDSVQKMSRIGRLITMSDSSDLGARGRAFETKLPIQSYTPRHSHS